MRKFLGRFRQDDHCNIGSRCLIATKICEDGFNEEAWVTHYRPHVKDGEVRFSIWLPMPWGQWQHLLPTVARDAREIGSILLFFPELRDFRVDISTASIYLPCRDSTMLALCKSVAYGDSPPDPLLDRFLELFPEFEPIVNALFFVDVPDPSIPPTQRTSHATRPSPNKPSTHPQHRTEAHP